MNLEENIHILENKELKTNTQKKRYIYVNKKSDKYFTNGLVTIIHQEQFNQLKKEYNELKELNENPITKEDFQKLELQIQQLQEENQELQITNEKLTEELTETSFKLELAVNNKTLEELTSSKNETISILKEDKLKLEEKVDSYKSEIVNHDEKNKNKISTLTSENTALKIALTKTISEYEHLINRSLINRILNEGTVELSDYKKLVESKEKYVPEVISMKKK